MRSIRYLQLLTLELLVESNAKEMQPALLETVVSPGSFLVNQLQHDYSVGLAGSVGMTVNIQ